ncbi:MAG: hypothetical protein A2Y28_01775 [Chlamydiae bacterium GWC2_50_10]|nr:MAG: hypothetical protein A2Y28_01775 [Chlamydiae bacterium GWC2_50_10]HCJ84564.1 hypothetical protein [Parachlamydiales bacterium]
MKEKRVSLAYRIFSRLIDYTLCALLLHSSTWFLPFAVEPLFYLLGALALPLIAIPLEALTLFNWQTTPGRALIGIRMLEEGKKTLSFKGAWRASLFFLKRSRRLSCIFSMGRKGRILASFMTLFVTTAFAIGTLFFPQARPLALLQKAEGWLNFVSSEGRFSIYFPVKPILQHKAIEIAQAKTTLELQEYVAALPSENEKEIFYTVSYVTLPRAWLLARSKTILNAALYLFYESQFGTKLLVKDHLQHWGRFSALHFQATEGDKRVQVRFVLCGSRLYQIKIIEPISLETNSLEKKEEALVTTFFESFNPRIS